MRFRTLVAAVVLIVPILGFGFNPIMTEDSSHSTLQGLSVIDGSYHTFAEVESDLQSIALTYPNITKLISIGKTVEGRDIWAIKISDNPDVEENEPEVYYNSAHHAREWMTPEVTLCLANALVENYTSDQAIKDIVDNRQIWIVPVVNPDGRVWDGADDPTNYKNWRKNRKDNGDGTRGVDLNRNYDYMWGGAGASDQTFGQTYRGPYGFSENETAAIRDFVRQHDFVFSISYHSYGQLILYPWGYTYNESEDHDLFASVGNEMANRITNTAGSIVTGYTPQKSSDLYLTSGTDDDWLYGEAGIYSFTFELYPHSSDSFGNPAVTSPYNRFHPRADRIVPVCNDNIPAALYLADIADNPFQVMNHVTLSSNLTEQKINQTETKDFTVNVLNDGNIADMFDISVPVPPGWFISANPGTVSLSRNSSASVTVSVTPSAFAEGEFNIPVTAKSQTNSSVEDTLVLTVNVPYLNDAGVEALAPFQEWLDYPTGKYQINSTVKNFGKNSQSFNTSLEIFKLGPPETRTLLEEDAEDNKTDWTAVDLDGPYSPTIWHMTTSANNSGSRSWWVGNPSGTKYSNNAAQILVSPPFSLKEALGANLSFYHKHEIESSYDYGNLDIYNGSSWDMIEVFTGTKGTFGQYKYDMKDYVGLDDLMMRFRFSSDSGLVMDGWFVDDINITAEFTSESLYHGPVNATSSFLSEDSDEDMSWNYRFTEDGKFKVVSTTWLPSDANPDNDELYVRMNVYRDTAKPEIDHMPVAWAETGDVIAISANVADDVAVEAVALNYTDTLGTIYNKSMTLSGGQYVYGIPAQTSTGTITYFIWANDTSDNENRTQGFQISVTQKVIDCDIFGTATDDKDSPLKDAKVEVLDGATILDYDYTNSQGEFDIEGLPCGDYVLSITKDGYESVEENIDANSPDQGVFVLTEIVPLDNDGDGVPDVDDIDDDNDKLSDKVEADMGTNPFLKDTDGDGFMDNEDYHPLDPNRHSAPVEGFPWLLLLIPVLVFIVIMILFLFFRRRKHQTALPPRPAP